MTTYADPTRCPDCHAVLPPDPQVCRVCSLPLTGQTVVSLFTTLQEADRLLGVLRTQKRPAPATVGVPVAPAGTFLEGAEAYPAPGRRPAQAPAPRPLPGRSWAPPGPGPSPGPAPRRTSSPRLLGPEDPAHPGCPLPP